jgi:AcrR family transcriptional regulator
MQPTVSQESTEPMPQNNSTREKILQAAKVLFVERGFSGTSMGQIALKAGVNHSLLFHHFGNKQNLWQAVKQAVIEHGKSVYEILPSADQPLPLFLKELIERAVVFYKKNEEITRLVNWQRLEFVTEQIGGIDLAEESKNWLMACRHYQEKGEVNPGLKPEFIVTLILSIVAAIAMDPNAFIQDPENHKAYVNFCIESLLKALAPDK